MKFLKTRLILFLSFYGASVMCADNQTDMTPQASRGKKLHENMLPQLIADTTYSDAVIPWPYQDNRINSGPSACNENHFIAWVGNRLNICKFGIGNPIRWADIDVDEGMIFNKEQWDVTLSNDKLHAAVSLPQDKEHTLGILLYEWSQGSVQPITNEKITTKNIGRSFALFDPENTLHYATKSQDGIAIVSHKREKTTDIPTQAQFLSLLHYSGWIKAAFTDDAHNIQIYDPSIQSFLPTLKGHTSHASSVKLTNGVPRAVSCADLNVRVWDLQTGNCLKSLNAVPSNIYKNWFYSMEDCCFSGIGTQYVIGVGMDGINIWNTLLEQDTPIAHIMKGVMYYNVSASGRAIVAGGPNQGQFLIRPPLPEKTDIVIPTVPAQATSLLSSLSKLNPLNLWGQK